LFSLRFSSDKHRYCLLNEDQAPRTIQYLSLDMKGAEWYVMMIVENPV